MTIGNEVKAITRDEAIDATTRVDWVCCGRCKNWGGTVDRASWSLHRWPCLLFSRVTVVCGKCGRRNEVEFPVKTNYETYQPFKPYITDAD